MTDSTDHGLTADVELDDVDSLYTEYGMVIRLRRQPLTRSTSPPGQASQLVNAPIPAVRDPARRRDRTSRNLAQGMPKPTG